MSLVKEQNVGKHWTFLPAAVCVAVLAVGASHAGCPQADLDGDCAVGVSDLSILAEQWLGPPEQEGDLNLDDRVDHADFALLASDWLAVGAPVAINEWMASNNGTVQDPQGDDDDWIELYNYGSVAYDLAGRYLTDDPEEPTQWQFPADEPGLTTIPAGGYLVVWADGDTADAGLHASFKLNADAEQVLLFDSDGATLVDSVEFSDEVTNISSGRHPDGGFSIQQMTVPTPGAANSDTLYGVVEDVQFSHKRGFYEAAFDLVMATDTAGATIRFTTDGSAPSASRGTVYASPVHINRTTTLRAAAFKTGYRSSTSETQTYLFVEDVKRQSPNGEKPGSGWPSGGVNGQDINYGMDPDIVNSSQYGDLVDDALLAIPSISIVTDLDHLFSSSSGIYVNARQDGRVWERPASVELIHPDQSDGFQINAGLRIRGGYSRSGNNPKHAFRLFFRQDYGEGKLRYPLFGDEGTDAFDKVDLRCSQNYSWAFSGDSRNTMVREVWSRDLQGEMGQPYTRSRYYHLYLNGHYWGIYMTQERSEARYAESYMGGDKEDYDVVKVDTNAGRTIMATDGNLDAYHRLHAVAKSGFDNEKYNLVQGLGLDGQPNATYEKLLDVDNLIDFMIIEYYTGDRDGPGSRYGNIPNNMYGIYSRTDPNGWKWFQHDSEHSLGTGENNLVTPLTWAGSNVQYFNPHWLHEQLTAVEEYRYRFADRVQKYLFNGGLLSREQAIARVDRRAAQIDSAIIAESARWGDSKRSNPRTRGDWLSAVNGVRNWIYQRGGVLLTQLRGQGWFPPIDAPVLSSYGGHVPSDFSLVMGADEGQLYYTTDGSDPRLSTSAYSNITTLVSPDAAKRALVPFAEVDVQWRESVAFDDSQWLEHSGSPGGVGYEAKPTDATNYVSYIGLDTMSLMLGNRLNPTANPSCLIRIVFSYQADGSEQNFMNLNMQYDDGFVAYLNGVEIARANLAGTPYYASRADADRADSDAVAFKQFDVSAFMGQLRQGDNLLAIHGLNSSTGSPDFLINAELVVGKKLAAGTGIADSAMNYSRPVRLDKSTHIKARTLVGQTWSALTEAAFAVGPVAENLRITELMYHPAEGAGGGENEEYIELQNIGDVPINLNLVRFTDGVEFTFGDHTLSAGEFALVVEDRDAFEARYGSGLPVVGEYRGNLANNGERLTLADALGQTISDFEYSDDWRDLTDGEGFSLVIIDVMDPDVDSWGEKDSWRASTFEGGSPGSPDAAELPNPGAIVINEVLAHSHDEASDWIELHNTTGNAIDISGWFLSDSAADFDKYEIPAGTVIEPFGYRVFYETGNFGASSGDPGRREPFALSENGEVVCLTAGAAGLPMGYRETEDFGASQTAVSLGRYFKGSTGNVNFVAMSAQSPMAANAYPQVGPVVIHEIMYHPDWPGASPYVNDRYEYIELRNIGSVSITLYDYTESEAWKFTEGLDYVFPSDAEACTIPAGGVIVVVRDKEAFMWRYPTVPEERIFGPYSGRLDDAGETVELSMPGDVDAFGERQYIWVERVVYSDGNHDGACPGGVDLWPSEADGQGRSLARLSAFAYGNDPNNWDATVPSPGF